LNNDRLADNEIDVYTNDEAEYRDRAELERLRRVSTFMSLMNGGNTYDGKAERFPKTETDANIISSDIGAKSHEGHRARLRHAAADGAALDRFGDAEILELLLSYFIPRKDTSPIARELLRRYSTLSGVLNAGKELERVSGMTHNAAVMLGLLAVVGYGERIEYTARGTDDAIDYFGSLFMSGSDGTFVMFLDERFGVIAVEHFGEGGSIKKIVGSAIRRNAAHVLAARRENRPFPDCGGVIDTVTALEETLKSAKLSLADYIVFNDYGYYTLGSMRARKTFGTFFEFVPLVASMRAQELYEAMTAED